MFIKKKTGTQVYAWRLGDNSAKEQELMKEGKIKRLDDGKYEIFSQESVNGTGEIASIGDYFKVDSSGFPYPNDKVFFEMNHKQIGEKEENLYEQTPKVLQAWSVEEGVNEEIQFLMQNKGLEICEDDESNYFRAPLWGSLLSAGKDAVIVFYSIEKEGNHIKDIDFNFVARKEFEITYDYVGEK